MGYKIRELERFAVCFKHCYTPKDKKEIDNLAYKFMKENNNHDIIAMKQIYGGLKEMLR